MVLLAVVEIEKNSVEKFEYDGRHFKLDRILAIEYPEAYGFIPNTLAGDEDPMDVVIISDQPLKQGAIVPITIICTLDMKDEHGQDEKIIAKPEYENVELTESRKQSIHDFFKNYKKNDISRWSHVKDWLDEKTSTSIIKQSIYNFMNQL